LRSSQYWIWCHVVQQMFTDISEEHTASIFRVKE
jgi:hypothetical protein